MNEFLLKEGYTDLKELDTGEVAGLFKFLFTTGLVVGLTKYGYRVRYCFEHVSDARQVLKTWNGIGHPDGNWIKAKGTDEYGVHIDECNIK
jgi:hypothetical protein